MKHIARRFRRHLPGLTVGAALVCLAAGCSEAGLDYAVGTLERDRLELAADSSEPIIAIPVSEGQAVMAGAELLRQDTARVDASLARARAERDRALAVLQEAEHGPRVQTIAGGRARLAAAESTADTARRELDRERDLIEQGFAAQNQVDILSGRYDAAVAATQEARAALDELLEGSRAETIAQARSAYQAAVAAVAELEVTLQRATLRAPADAVVEALPFELGERPQPGQLVVVLRSGPSFARVHIPEPLRVRLTVGMAARVTVDGHADSFAGRIRWISSEAAFTPYFALTQQDRSRLSYLAEIDVDSADLLPAGIPVEARFPDSESGAGR